MKKEKIGWMLFLLCSIVYIIDSIRLGSMLYLIGGLLFFFGCIAFMWPEKNNKEAE